MDSQILTSPSVAALAAALAKAQAQIAPAPKSSVNPHFRSHYADLASVVDASRAALAANGLAVVQCPVDSSRPDSVALATRLIHSSGEWIESTVSTRLAKNDAQGVGSALTYLRRYSLAAIVGVTSCEDDDGNAASRTPEPPARSAPAPKPKTPSVAAEEPPSRFIASLAEVAAKMSGSGGYEVRSIQETSGEKGGKPWTRYALDLVDAENDVTVSTFSSTLAAVARSAAANNQRVNATWHKGAYGLLLDSIEAVAGTEVADGIPF